MSTNNNYNTINKKDLIFAFNDYCSFLKKKTNDEYINFTGQAYGAFLRYHKVNYDLILNTLKIYNKNIDKLKIQCFYSNFYTILNLLRNEKLDKCLLSLVNDLFNLKPNFGGNGVPNNLQLGLFELYIKNKSNINNDHVEIENINNSQLTYNNVRQQDVNPPLAVTFVPAPESSSSSSSSSPQPSSSSTVNNDENLNSREDLHIGDNMPLSIPSNQISYSRILQSNLNRENSSSTSTANTEIHRSDDWYFKQIRNSYKRGLRKENSIAMIKFHKENNTMPSQLFMDKWPESYLF